MKIEISDTETGYLLRYTDDEEGHEGTFSFTDSKEFLKKLMLLVARMEARLIMDRIMEDVK